MPTDPNLQPVSLLPPNAYVFSCIANRYLVKKEEGFTLAYFGLVDGENKLLDRFSCAFTEPMLFAQKDNLVQYLEKIGPVQKPIPGWGAPPPRDEHANTLADLMNFSVVDFIHLSSGQDFGELCFWNYSQGMLGDKLAPGHKPEIATIATWGVGMVRCSLDLQRAFLDALYPH